MRRNARCPRPPRPAVLAPRRGNSIVLVMGILVLLVIIATAFITRTHAGRLTASVTVRTTLRDDNARAMAEMLADEISMALFPRPVDPDDPALPGVGDSNFPRLTPLRNPIRYGADQDNDGPDGFPSSGDDDGFPDYPYNFAPYTVVPFTNWPDGAADPFWPDGPGNDGGGTGNPNLDPEGNPVGNPGFGDARWLADLEPLRWIIGPGPDGAMGTPDDTQAFSHWRHMTNIAHPNNGWRIVVGLDDVESGLVTGLEVPVEQWLSVMPQPAPVDPLPIFNPLTGNTVYKPVDFTSRWDDWFFDYAQTYWDPTLVPPNFYDLGDLDGGLDQDGDGNLMDPGERPQDEFSAGSARHAVSSILADTDGDGFTDSFWYLAPTMTERGIRQVVAVRIIDNSAMLNVNVATRFNRLNTTGATPSDLALVGELSTLPPPDNYNVGIFDNPAHHEPAPDPFFYGGTTIGYNPLMWADWMTGPSDRALNYLQQIGVINQDFLLNLNFSTELNTALDRLTYWQLAGLRPLEPVGGLTPFGFTEELELRMFHGQNYPWIVSRFEKAVQAEVLGSAGMQFLHANRNRQESSEYLDQLSNVELVFDHRRKLTMYSGARNDQMPPWLWWRWDLPDDIQQDIDDANGIGNFVLAQQIEDNFLAQARRKLDLREEANPPLFDGERKFSYRLARTLMLALTDGDQANGNSYYGVYLFGGPFVNALTHARRLAAGLAANILESRDADFGYGFVQNSSVPLPPVGDWGQELTQRFLGMEKQPFLVEALIAHVYELEPAMFPHPFINPDDHVLCGDPEIAGAVIVVQIANPYDAPLTLSDFDLSVFGEPVALTGSIPPGDSRTYYAMEEDFDGADLADEWVPLLDALNAVRVPSNIWTTDPDDFDALDEDHAIELIRRIGSNSGGNIGTARVVVDRIDIEEPPQDPGYLPFGDAVESMRGLLPGGSCVEPPFGFEWPGVVNLGNVDNHWIQWVHVTRAWDVDLNMNGGIDPNERNPRYVFAIRAVDVTNANGSAGTSVAPTENPAKFDVKDKDFDGSHPAFPNFNLNFSMQMLQKDADFEQVGELLNVWMFGHHLKFEAGLPGQIDTAYDVTIQTFSEFMIEKDLAGEEVRANRLTIVPDKVDPVVPAVGQVVGFVAAPVDILDRLHAVPAVPAGARVLEAFVCDNGRLNANGFSGKSTPGLINVNTAPPEVMRSAPHMARLVHELNTPSNNPFVRVPEAIVRYRERFGDPIGLNEIFPIYGNRGGGANPPFFLGNPDLVNLRGERGFASLGELMLLMEPASFPLPMNLEPDDNWLIDFASRDPYGNGGSTQISTDVNDPVIGGTQQPDIVAEDAEELNLLFSGMSNMLTTRSDVFTVYFRVRSFIQNPTTGVWDATNPEFIVDDSRYVMLVDRSEVNHPNDKPKILYLEKLPK
ncbi:MAG: hypothetical protein V3T84_16295 [Phycisphaerales bacterium]